VIVVDTSAVIAILFSEPDALHLRRTILGNSAAMPATCLVETQIVVSSARASMPKDDIDQLVRLLRLTIQPITPTIAQSARDAFLRYGKGRHPAALNFGDCFSYAVAKELDAPLLFKGDDFRLTDVRVAADLPVDEVDP
jgi:ribonuclease VapC